MSELFIGNEREYDIYVNKREQAYKLPCVMAAKNTLGGFINTFEVLD